jgi:hypothetical protein
MKAEHRRELEKNALADSLNRALEGLKKGPSRGTIIFCSVIALIIVLFFGYRYFGSWSAQKNSTRWIELEDAPGPKELDQFAKDNSGTMPARIAQFQRARILFQRQLLALGADSLDQRKEALDKIKEAAELFEKLAEQSKDSPMLAQEALLSAAKAYESINDLPKAEENYKKLESRFGKSGLAREAAPLAARFDSEEDRQRMLEFYTRFNNLAERKPSDK